jgi:two-component system sensor histidine kinase/response regulator
MTISRAGLAFPRGIAFRIGAPIGLLVALLILALGLYYPARQAALFRDATNLRMQELALVTALGVERALESGDFELLARTISTTRASRDFAYVALVQVDAEGSEQVFASNPVDLDPTLVLAADDGAAYLTADAPIGASGFDGVVRVGASEARLLDSISALNRPVYELMLLLLAGAAVVIASIASIVTRPVIQLTEAAERLATGDYDRPIESTDDSSEIGNLTRSLRGLQSALLEARSRMQEYVDGVIEARDAAEEATRAKSSFVANVSHEIRTPIGAVVGLTHLCLQTDLSDDQRRYLLQIEAASQSLISLVNEVLDFSKLEAESLALEAEPFDLDEVLAAVTSIGVGLVQSEGVTFSVETDPEVPRRLVGDALRLQQILVNLVGNALKFTRRGSVRVEVAATSTKPGLAKFTFRVRDTGIGMAPDTVGRLFLPFEQADSSTTRRFGGTGLGLSITDLLVRTMGGTVDVHSAVGVGSTFTVTLNLPIASSQAWTSIESGRAVEGTSHAYDWSDARVLVVEDNSFNQLVIRDLLERAGAQVEVASDGVAGVEAVDKGPPFDLILMDIQMPRMDGYTAARVIRDRFATGPGPVMAAMTANTSAEDRRRSREAGMTGFLSKPILPRDFYRAVNALLQPDLAADDDAVPAASSSHQPLTPPLGLTDSLQVAALYDRELLRDLGSSDASFFNQFVTSFEASARETLREWAVALAEEDADQAMRLGHKFKSAVGMIGAMAMYDHAVAVESLARDEEGVDWASVRSHVDAMGTLIDPLCAQLRDQARELASE